MKLCKTKEMTHDINFLNETQTGIIENNGEKRIRQVFRKLSSLLNTLQNQKNSLHNAERLFKFFLKSCFS